MIADRYSLEREIGRGGSGAVWLGRDELLGRAVAMKRIGLLPGADDTDLARAEREARLSASLNHPNVVTVFDVAVENDAHWLVMEYVDGPTLAQLVQQGGPLPPNTAANLLWQVSDALAAAHAAGVVHRDVKPSNILIDRNGNAQLSDFGIARVESDPSLTQTGVVTGSPSYLAPEVAQGNRAGEAADVWSLGATAFHVLAGRPPYEVDGNVLGALYRIVHEDPPELPEAGPLAPLLAGTMVKDPDRRWSMTKVRDFLAGAAQGESTISLGTMGPVSTEPITDTRSMPTPIPGPAPATVPVTAPATSPVDNRERRGVPRVALVAGAVAAALLAVVLVALLANRDPDSPGGPAAQESTTQDVATQGPTAQGIEAFIRDYVQTVAEDPDESWKMLTPKFQRESGGLETYRSFWEDATNGRVLEISSNPDELTVSYQVRFDNFDNGPGPTVLDLAFEDGRYRIDGERTEGFVPAD